MPRVRTVTFGDARFEFDEELVNGLDAWAFHVATGADLVDAMSEFARCSEAGDPPAFHVAVVAKWLSVRQNANALAPFAAVAAATRLPFRNDPPEPPTSPAPVSPDSSAPVVPAATVSV